MPQFVEPIRLGTKGGTIRAPRKAANRGIHSSARQVIGGHAYAGEELALYCRQRHPSGFLIDRRRCLSTEPIIFNFAARAIVFPAREDDGLCDQPEQVDAFARFDGFACWDELDGFWRRTHGAGRFDGWHIRWLPLPEEVSGC